MKAYIKKEMERLRDPLLIEGPANAYSDAGILKRSDFFDLLLLIQLKTKLKLSKEVGRNQRDRVKLLEMAMYPQSHGSEDYIRNAYDIYFSRTMEIM